MHTGECEVVGGEVGGMAVHIGARVAALAGPGEVLVSGSVRDLMTGSDRHFEGGEARGAEGGRGAVAGVPAGAGSGQRRGVASRRPSMVPLYTRRQRRRLLVVLAAVLVVALALPRRYLLTRPADAEVVVGENAVGVIGPGDEPRVSAAVEVGQRPTAVAAGFGSVWVTNSTADSVSRIDRTHERPRCRSRSGSSPSGVAVGAGSVWVANSGDATVSRIDPATVAVDADPGPARARPGSWWRSGRCGSPTPWTPRSPRSTRTPTRSRKVVPVGAGPTGIAAGAGYLWVTNQGDGTVTRFDPDTYEKDSPVTVGSGPVGIAVGGGAAWVANNLDGSLSRIDVEDLTVDGAHPGQGAAAPTASPPAAGTCGSATSTPAP